jgi:hypothetical protein
MGVFLASFVKLDTTAEIDPNSLKRYSPTVRRSYRYRKLRSCPKVSLGCYLEMFALVHPEVLRV